MSNFRVELASAKPGEFTNVLDSEEESQGGTKDHAKKAKVTWQGSFFL